MQQKSERNLEFSERTERICSLKTLKLKDLPGLLGISPAMFFAYRSGKHPVSEKAWRKLEKLESDLGVRVDSLEEHKEPTPAPEDIVRFLRLESERAYERYLKLKEAADLIDRSNGKIV